MGLTIADVLNQIVLHTYVCVMKFSVSLVSSSSGGEGPDMLSIGKPKCWSPSKDKLSTLLAFLQSLETDPWRLKNSLESNPGPLLDTNMAELILGRCLLAVGVYFC